MNTIFYIVAFHTHIPVRVHKLLVIYLVIATNRTNTEQVSYYKRTKIHLNNYQIGQAIEDRIVYGLETRLQMLQALWGSFWATLYFYLRPMIKWILRRVTGKCELLRISYGYQPGVQRTKYIESSLKRSRNGDLQRLAKDKDTNVEAAVVLVMKAKSILPEIHARFEDIFRQCLIKINAYIRLQNAVENIRVIKYSSDNPEHEKKLMQLWAVLMDGEKLESRTCSQWTQIGFQGNDPQTDFRGMGQLGLDQLIYFTTRYTKHARSMLSRSQHPSAGYSFAIVGINMTELLYTLLKNGTLRSYFYAIRKPRPSLEDYHEVYCFLFYEFDKFWTNEKPKDIMEFGRVREKYRKKIVSQLKDRQNLLDGKFRICETDT